MIAPIDGRRKSCGASAIEFPDTTRLVSAATADRWQAHAREAEGAEDVVGGCAIVVKGCCFVDDDGELCRGGQPSDVRDLGHDLVGVAAFDQTGSCCECSCHKD